MGKKIFLSWFAVLVLWVIFYTVTMNRRSKENVPEYKQIETPRDTTDSVVFKRNN